MKIKAYILVVLALVLFLMPITLKRQVFVEQRETNEQGNFFEMSLEDLMELEITSVSKEKEKLAEAAAAAIQLLDFNVRNI